MSQYHFCLSNLAAKIFIPGLLDKCISVIKLPLFLWMGLTLAACGGIAPEPTTLEPVSVVSPIAPSLDDEVSLISKPTRKLSPRLQMLADPAFTQQDVETQAQALSLPVSGPGSLMRNEDGGLLVNIRLADISAENQQALIEAGADIINVAEEYRTVTAYVIPENLSNLADLAVVENIQEELQPQK